MAYEGATLRDFVERMEKAVHPSMMIMADDVGENMTNWVIKNTPIEKFVKEIGEPHLRDRIFQKDTIVYVDALGRKVYETGTETEVDYAPFVEEDTLPHVIEPRVPGGTLRFIDQATGQPVFAKKVQHPGTTGHHMFAIGAAMAEHEFEAAAERGLAAFERAAERRVIGAPIAIPLTV